MSPNILNLYKHIAAENLREHSKDYIKIVKQYLALKNLISDKLNDCHKDNFDTLCELQNDLEELSSELYFAEGFKLGLAIAAESFLDK